MVTRTPPFGGGLNGVGSDAIEEQSKGGLREEGFGSGIRDRRTAAYSRHSHTMNASFLGVAPR